MRISGRRYRDEWFPNFYPARKIGDDYIRISRSGKAIVLTEQEDASIDEFYMEEELFLRLEKSSHILTPANIQTAATELAQWLSGTYDGPGLHIVVPTRRCNLSCTYCHMYPQPVSSSREINDLDLSLIPKICDFILSSPRKRLSVEFQGGEPFLNFPAIQAAVLYLEDSNACYNKILKFSIVSNLMVVTDQHLQFCRDHNIGISYTLNGPEHIHDLFRITATGSGSHAAVIKKIDYIKANYPGLLASYPLCVITEHTAEQLDGLIQYYYDLGFTDIGLIALKNLGHARDRMHFDMREYLKHYFNVLDRIYEMNKTSPKPLTERMVRIALSKLLGNVNPLFIDWRNPIGYFTNSVIYDVDGEVLPADEARSLRDHFSVGNVRTDTYASLIEKKETFRTVNLSIRDRHPVCRECAYNPYCGVSPVLHFSKTGSMAPEPNVSDECLFTQGIFDWIFNKIAEDPLPLLRMLPEYATTVTKLLAESIASRMSDSVVD